MDSREGAEAPKVEADLKALVARLVAMKERVRVVNEQVRDVVAYMQVNAS
jgi:cytochrome c1